MKYFILLFVLLISLRSKSQVLTDMGSYRNIFQSSISYTGSFSNTTFGIARREYFKLIHREIIGILDVSFPVNNHFFTKHILKKGFQVDLVQKGNFRLPFTFASASIARKNDLFKFLDFTAEFNLNPGYYHKRFYVALDLKYEMIAFRYTKYSQEYRDKVDNKAHNHCNRPSYDAFKIGFISGINFNKWTIYIKTGYEKNPFTINNYIPGYLTFGGGYKFGQKPFKNKNTTSITKI